MRLTVAIISVVLAVTQARFNPELDHHWDLFKKIYTKQYAKDEDIIRRSTWENNLLFIEKHNMEEDLGLQTYRVGMNEYGDWTPTEFTKYLKGYLQSNATLSGSLFMTTNLEVPSTVDWRKHGYVTGVKNQKQCGSCWAFSATGSLEGQHFKKTGKLVSLSEQDLVDCSKKQGNFGCGGGLPGQAFKYVIENGGIDTEESYPYEAKDGKCRFKKEDVGATCTGMKRIESGDEAALKQATATVGPISVGIDAARPSFQLYKSGVYYDKKCNPKALDHGVLVVGYGTEGGKDYWLVKNSWGATWGQKGYIMMSRNHKNNCGIATQPVYPIV